MTELHWSEVVRGSSSAKATRSAGPAPTEHRATEAGAIRITHQAADAPPQPDVEPVSTFLVALAEGAVRR